MKLYSYWRSSTSFRVRAALNLKGLPHQIIPVDLAKDAQHQGDYTSINPSGGVPALVLDDGMVLKQSLAILDYLDAVAAPLLTPKEPVLRAKTLAVAHSVALDIHPVNNLRVVQKLQRDFGADASRWMQHWMQTGFVALEKMLAADTRFALTEAPTIADLCIVAQAYNAHRWTVDLTPFPKIQRVEAACLSLPEIQAAHPDTQPDAEDIS